MIGRMRTWILIFIFQLLPPFLFADVPEANLLQEVSFEDFDYGSEFIKMMGTLAFLLILIFVSIYVLKRLLRSRSTHLNKAHGIKILERRSLTQKSAIYLVDILGKGFIIGESANGIHLISAFPENVDISALLEQEKPPTELQANLSKLFAKGLGKFKMPLLKKTKGQGLG